MRPRQEGKKKIRKVRNGAQRRVALGLGVSLSLSLAHARVRRMKEAEFFDAGNKEGPLWEGLGSKLLLLLLLLLPLLHLLFF